MGRIPLLQGQASTIAGEMDLLFAAVTAVAVFFSIGIALAIIYLAMRYRRGAKVDRSNPPQYNHHVELAWTVIPLGIAIGIFAWATSLYFSNVRIPPGAMEVQVVGKQWMWKLQHPTGRWEMNELHIPAGRPIALTMTSEDVVHAFFIPAFRVKWDVYPGQYTRMWFQATKPGRYSLFCAEFCGTLHSKMIGQVVVMEPAEYERWLAEGPSQETIAAQGERLFRRHGCSGCHAPNSSVRAPLLEGIYGKPRPVQIARGNTPIQNVPATTVVADQRYIHDAIVLPEKEVAAGYKPIMPTYKNRLTEEEIFQIVAYLKSLGGQTESRSAERAPASLTADDYRARTGFTPENIGSLTAGGANGTGSPRNERNPR